jgi:hypothetical protein
MSSIVSHFGDDTMGNLHRPETETMLDNRVFIGHYDKCGQCLSPLKSAQNPFSKCVIYR